MLRKTVWRTHRLSVPAALLGGLEIPYGKLGISALRVGYGHSISSDNHCPCSGISELGRYRLVRGIIRDILAGEPSILLRPELYVTAAALSAGLTVGFALLGVPSYAGAIAATACGLCLRGGAILKGWELPTYR